MQAAHLYVVTLGPRRGPGWRRQAGDAVGAADGGDSGSAGIDFPFKGSF